MSHVTQNDKIYWSCGTMPEPSTAGVAGVMGVAGCRLDDDWAACTNDSAEPVCAGGAENMPTLAPVLAAELEPTAFGTVYDTAVLTGENRGACCNGGVGYKYHNVVLRYIKFQRK